MASGAGYLPPVVAQVVASADDLIAKLQEAKAYLADFSKEQATAELTGDDAPLVSKIAAATAAVKVFAAQRPTLTVDANTAPALAEIAGLRAAIDMLGMGGGGGGRSVLGGLTGGTGEGGGGGDLAAGSLGYLFGRGGKSAAKAALWGEVGGGFLQRLLSPLTMLTTLFSAGFGSVGELAGFGPEHALLTMLGMGGSATAGLGGGGALLALGSLGKMMVGGGSDTLVSHEMISNVEALVKGTETLAQVTAKVGPVAAQAEAALAKAYSGMTASFDKTTGAAQAEAAGIGMSLVKLADAYIPMVAQAAQRNFAIISKALQPLFSWLEGPAGMAIFQQLENAFAKTLPTAINAFDQAIELVLRTMGIASEYTGGFIKKLDDFLKKMNSPAGFLKWENDIGTLIGLFHTWMKLIEAVGKTLVKIFSDSAGLGSSIAKELTDMLTRLDKYLDSAKGGAALTNLFKAHKNEILELLKLLPSLVSGFGKLYMILGPAFVNTVTSLLKVIDPLLSALSKNPFGQWAIGLGLIEMRTHALSAGFKFLKNLPGTIHSVVTAIGAIPGKISSAASAVANFGSKVGSGLSTAWSAVSTFASNVGSAIATGFGKAVSAVETFGSKIGTAAGRVASFVSTNITGAAKAAAGWVASGASTLAGWIKTAAQTVARVAVMVATNIAGAATSAAAWIAANALMTLGIALIVAAVVAAVVLIVTHWKLVSSTAVAVWNDIVSFVKTAVADVVSTVSGLVSDVVGFFTGLKTSIKNTIVNGLADAGTWLVDIGKNIVQGLINGITGMVGTIAKTMKSIGSDVINAAKSILGIFSPSTVFADMGGNIGKGLTQGITGSAASAVAAVTSMARQVTQAGRTGLSAPMGTGLTLAGAGGIGAVTISAPITITVAGPTAATAPAIGTAVQQAVDKSMQKVVKQLKSGAYSRPGQ